MNGDPAGMCGAANAAQAAFNMALQFEFLLGTLLDARRQPAAAAG